MFDYYPIWWRSNIPFKFFLMIAESAICGPDKDPFYLFRQMESRLALSIHHLIPLCPWEVAVLKTVVAAVKEMLHKALNELFNLFSIDLKQNSSN